MVSTGAHSQKSSLRVVVIGASAGSLEPLRRMLGRITHDHVSYVVATHLSPNRDSQLAALLQKHSVLPVSMVREPITLRPNQVYVGGEGVALTIEGDVLYTEAVNRAGPRRSIDRLMTTLADSWGARAIGVVLSGAGYDGASGLAAIQAAGGLTMVQTPESATWKLMPKSAQPFAQHCLPPEALGDQLMHLLNGVRIPQA